MARTKSGCHCNLIQRSSLAYRYAQDSNLGAGLDGVLDDIVALLAHLARLLAIPLGLADDPV